jgi:hypothetical protein
MVSLVKVLTLSIAATSKLQFSPDPHIPRAFWAGGMAEVVKCLRCKYICIYMYLHQPTHLLVASKHSQVVCPSCEEERETDQPSLLSISGKLWSTIKKEATTSLLLPNPAQPDPILNKASRLTSSQHKIPLTVPLFPLPQHPSPCTPLAAPAQVHWQVTLLLPTP